MRSTLHATLTCLALSALTRQLRKSPMRTAQLDTATKSRQLSYTNIKAGYFGSGCEEQRLACLATTTTLAYLTAAGRRNARVTTAEGSGINTSKYVSTDSSRRGRV